MKIMASVGQGGVNNEADVYLVQWALSEIEILVEKKKSDPKAKPELVPQKLWESSKLSGKSSAALQDAIGKFQSHLGITVTKKVAVNGLTHKKLVESAPRVKHWVATVCGIITQYNFDKIVQKSKTRMKLVLLKAPLLSKESRSLAKLIEMAGKEGIELDVNFDSVSIDRARGFLTAKINLLDGYYSVIFTEEKALKKYNSLLYAHAVNIWLSSVRDPLCLKSFPYDFLKPLKYTMGSNARSEYGFPEAKYKNNKVVKTVADAFSRIQHTRPNTTKESFPDRRKLARILYPILPTVSRKLIDLTTNESKLTNIDEFFPLYKAGIGVRLPLPESMGKIGFKANLILNPNNRTEHLYIEIDALLDMDLKALAKKLMNKDFKVLAPKPAWDIDDKFEPMHQSITDISAGSVTFSAKLNVDVRAGFLELKAETHDRPWNVKDPSFNMEALNALLLGVVNEQRSGKEIQKAKPKSREIINLDLGKISIQIDLHDKLDFNAEGRLRLGVTERFLFDFDADFWDLALYSFVDDVSDLEQSLKSDEVN